MASGFTFFGRPLYTAGQIQSLYERLDLPAQFRYQPGDFSREVIRLRDGIGFLSALVRHFVCAVPCENLELHYSPHQVVSLDPEILFEKLVAQRRGGYGLETNCFFARVLHSVGFDIRTVGVRINVKGQRPAGTETPVGGPLAFGGWSHMVNLVTIRGQTYLVDVGFGYGGPTVPVLVSKTSDARVYQNVRAHQFVRVRQEVASPQVEQHVWMYERLDSSVSPWTPVYWFTEAVDFIQQDFDMINYFVTTHRSSLLTQIVTCSRYALNAQTDEVFSALVLLDDRVYRYVGGVREEVAEFETEDGRVDALAEFFDITLSKAQREGIKGTNKALPG